MFYIKDKSGLYRVNMDDILYFQQEGRNINIVTETRSCILKRYKIKDIEEKLGKQFFKCHSYLIVNTDKIVSVSRNEAAFQNGASIGMCYAASLRLQKVLRTL